MSRKPGQSRAVVSNITNLQREVLAEGVGNAQAVIHDVGSLQVRVDAHERARARSPPIAVTTLESLRWPGKRRDLATVRC